MTVKHNVLSQCDNPEPQDIRHALDNKQVLWRYKNNRVQVLAQTLSSFLDTRTSSLLAVNKKQGVPAEFIHREWKRTWVDLKGLKVRVEHTVHGSALLKGLKQVIEILDAYKTAYTRPPMVSAEQQAKSASASAASGVANASTAPKPSASAASGVFDASSASAKPCDLAVEANKRAVHNTERLNKLTRDEKALENLIFKYRDACSIDLGTQSKRLDMFADRLHRIEKGDKSGENVPKLEKACHNQLAGRVHNLEDRVAVIEAGDRQAAQAMAEKKTPLDALSTRVSSLVTRTNRLDAKTDGLESRVTVVEDTSKWLSWSLATLVSLRFVGLMLRMLKRK